MSNELCESEGWCVAWNSVAIPEDIQLNNDAINPPAICVVSKGPNMEFQALKFSSLDERDRTHNPHQQEQQQLPMTTSMMMRLCLDDDIHELKWFKKHTDMEVSSIHPLGVLAVRSGKDKRGRTFIYDPAQILMAYSNALAKNPRVAEGVVCQKQCGLVCELQWPGDDDAAIQTVMDVDIFGSNTVSIGDSQGGVSFFDVETGAPPGGGVATLDTKQGRVRCLKWHPQTKEVLLCGADQGFTVLNPKSKKPLIAKSLESCVGNKQSFVSGLCWLETGKSVVVAYDTGATKPTSGTGSNCPAVIQIWDLRHTQVPYAELSAPTHRGIIKLEQHGLDPRFFMSASREGRCILWATSGPNVTPYSSLDVGESIDDFCLSQTAELPAVCVRHSPQQSGGVRASSLSDDENVKGLSAKLSWHPIDARSIADGSGNLSFSPLWLQSGSGLDFGFGGQLGWFATMGEKNDLVGGISETCCDETLISNIDQFIPYLERNDLGGYCEQKVNNCYQADSSPFDFTSLGSVQPSVNMFQHQVWAVIQTAFTPPEERSARILKILGYEASCISNEVKGYVSQNGGSLLENPSTMGMPDLMGLLPQSSRSQEGLTYPSGTPGSGLKSSGLVLENSAFDTENFFNRLAHTAKDETKLTDEEDTVETVKNYDELQTGTLSSSQAQEKSGSRIASSGPGYFVSTSSEQWKYHPMRLLKEAFLVGDSISAVEVALRTNQFGLAFILAQSINDANLMSSLKRAFMQVNRDPFVATVALTSENDFATIVRTRDLEDWKETVAAMTTYLYQSDRLLFRSLCIELAERLKLEQGDVQSAILAYLIAGGYQEAAESMATLPVVNSLSDGSQALQIFIIASIEPGLKLGREALKLIHRFTYRLVNAGRLSLATSILNVIDNVQASSPSQSSKQQLKYMIAESSSYDLRPTRPTFDYFDVQLSPDLTHTFAANQAPTKPALTEYQQTPGNRFGGPGVNLPASGMSYPPNANRPMTGMGGLPPPPLTGPGAGPPPVPGMGSSILGSKGLGPSLGPTPLVSSSMGAGMMGRNSPSQMNTANNTSFGMSNMPPPMGSYPQQPNAPPPMSSYPQQQAPPTAVSSSMGLYQPTSQQPLSKPLPAPPSLGSYQQQNQQSSAGSYYHQYPPPAATNERTNNAFHPSSEFPPGATSGFSAPLPPPPPILSPGSSQMPGAPQPPNAQSRGSLQQHDWIGPPQQIANPTPTHPAAAMSTPFPPGMPTPWPIPTSTQQAGTARVSAATEKLNQQVQTTQAPGVLCPRNDVMRIKQGLEGLILMVERAGTEDSRKMLDSRRAVEELISQLEGGSVTKEVQTKLLEFVEQMSNNECQAALACCQSMISLGWSKNSKNWLSSLKRLASSLSRSKAAMDWQKVWPVSAPPYTGKGAWEKCLLAIQQDGNLELLKTFANLKGVDMKTWRMFEAGFGYGRLPKEMKEFYLFKNGGEKLWPAERRGPLSYLKFNSLERSSDLYNTCIAWHGTVPEGDLNLGNDPDVVPQLRNSRLHGGWLPLMTTPEDLTDDMVCLDCNPPPGGTRFQILRILPGHLPARSCVIAPDWNHFVTNVLLKDS